MLLFVTVLHIIFAILLIAFVLLQDPKGGAMGLMGGGGSQQILSSTGAANLLTKITKWLAVGFALTSISLTYLTTHKGGSVTDDVAVPAAAATETAPPPAAADATPAAADAGTATNETAPANTAAPTTATPEKK